MRWTTSRFVLLGLGVALLALAGKEVRWALSARPHPRVDYAAKTNDVVLAAQSDPPSAQSNWRAFMSAIAEFEAMRSAAAARLSAHRPADWPPENEPGGAWPPSFRALARGSATPERVRAAARTMFESLDERALAARLDDVASRRGYARTIAVDGPLIQVLLPEVASTRELAAWARQRQRDAQARGDWAQATRSYEHQLALAGVLGDQATIIDRLVAFSIVAGADAELRAGLVERGPDAPALARLASVIDARVPLPSIDGALESERLFAMDVVQHSFSDDGAGDGRYIATAGARFEWIATSGAPPAAPSPWRNLLWFRQPGRAATERELSSFYADAIAQCRLPKPQRAPGSLDAKVAALHEAGFSRLARMLPAIGHFTHNADLHRLDVDATRVHVAIEGYRAATGEAPPRLDDLVPTYLPRVPADATSGGPLGYYRLVAGSDPQGRGYLLYAFGKDGADNDGKTPPPGPDGAPVCNPGGLAGFDEVFNTNGL